MDEKDQRLRRGIANALGIHRTTIDHYLSILERLFLVRRLPAWHRHSAKRLVKAPKLYLIDSGLILYAGPDSLPVGDPLLLAVPLSKVWKF